jgi:hypothetical protein
VSPERTSRSALAFLKECILDFIEERCREEDEVCRAQFDFLSDLALQAKFATVR